MFECVTPNQHFHHLKRPEVVVEVVREDRQCRCKSYEGRGAGTTITNILQECRGRPRCRCPGGSCTWCPRGGGHWSWRTPHACTTRGTLIPGLATPSFSFLMPCCLWTPGPSVPTSCPWTRPFRRPCQTGTCQD